MKKLFNTNSFVWVIFLLGFSVAVTMTACGGAGQEGAEEGTEQMEDTTQAEETEMEAEHHEGHMHDSTHTDSLHHEEHPEGEEHPAGGSEHPNG